MKHTHWIALALACATGAAFAQSVGSVQGSAPKPGTTGAPGNTGQGAATMAAYDEDGDGNISKDEAKGNADLRTRFVTLDRDGNGMLDKAEFARFEAAGGAPGSPGASSSSATSGTDSDTGSAAGDQGKRKSGNDRKRDADRSR